MGYIAPRIKSDGDKFNGHKAGEKYYEFSQIPNRLLSYVMRNIEGNCGNRLKLMIFLMGCGEGFEIHERTILNRTGMSQSAYSQARDWLDKNGFITYKKSCSNAIIKVNYAYMWSEIENEALEDYIERQDNCEDQEETRQSVIIGNREWTWETFRDYKDWGIFEEQHIDENEIRKQLEYYLGAPAPKK